VIRESGERADGDGRESAAGGPEVSSPRVAPSLTAPIARRLAASRYRARRVFRASPDATRADPAAMLRPVQRAALRGHVTLRHLAHARLVRDAALAALADQGDRAPAAGYSMSPPLRP
jgi:hypothetical protein